MRIEARQHHFKYCSSILVRLFIIIGLMMTPNLVGQAHPLDTAAGGIEGKVADNTNGPLVDIKVSATNVMTGETLQANTDASGNYSFSLEAGSYYLTTVEQYNDADGYVDEYYNDAPNQEESEIVIVHNGAVTSGIDFSLEPCGSISGIIQNSSGAPLEGASVMAISRDSSNRSFAASSLTGADGAYIIRGLPAGDYLLRATHPGSQPRFYGNTAVASSSTKVTVTANSNVSGKLISLPDQSVETKPANTIYLSMELPDWYDPSQSNGANQMYVIDQLFAGLTRLNSTDGSAIGDLAKSWTHSDDLKEWTFTLKNGLEWSDGTPLTSYDVKFGILRALCLDRTSPYSFASVLFSIEGAENYRNGKVSADQVGISIPSATEIKFTLNASTPFFPSIMALIYARPLPHYLIQAYRDTWRDPGMIITSGPYQMAEYDAQNHALFTKNPRFYGKTNVSIQNVLFYNMGTEEAWRKYNSGILDMAEVPSSKISSSKTDAVLNQQVAVFSVPCTYYVGFNTDALPAAARPSNPVLFRKALIESVNRDWLVRYLYSGDTPAWTFIAPGVFGHSDQKAGIHIPYDSSQALADMKAAFNGNYTSLAPVTLYYLNDAQSWLGGLKSELEYLKNTWNRTLNTQFSLQGLSMEEFEQKFNNNEMPIWQLRWGADYNDGGNFLNSVLDMHERYGGWDTTEYDTLLSQATSTADDAQRFSKYRELEEMILKTKALMMPVRHPVNAIVVKGSVKGYGFGGARYIGEWVFSRSDTLAINGSSARNSFASAESASTFTPANEQGKLSYTIPADAFSTDITLTHTGHLTGNLNSLPEGKGKTPIYFSLEAKDASDVTVIPSADYTLTVEYSGMVVAEQSLAESSLSLYYWDESASQWVRDPNSRVNTSTNTITTQSRHLGYWTVFGTVAGKHTSIPLMVR